MPNTSQMTTIITKIIVSFNPNEVIASTMTESMSDNDKNREYIPAVIKSIIIGAEVFPASITDSTIPFHLIPLKRAMAKLAKAPIPAASVGVKIPPQIPPNTTIIKPIIDMPDKNCLLLIFAVSPIVSGSGANSGLITAFERL